MELCKENFIIYASRAYTNEYCSSMEEFHADLEQHVLARKLSKKIVTGKSVNVRLLCNHIQCFTNNFEINAAKKIIMFEASDVEKSSLKTVLNYFGFIRTYEYEDVRYCLQTAKLLKDMDK